MSIAEVRVEQKTRSCELISLVAGVIQPKQANDMLKCACTVRNSVKLCCSSRWLANAIPLVDYLHLKRIKKADGGKTAGMYTLA